ncbi:MAG: hypothetical protein QG594_1780 [Bacteroidota bacterium]|nr:hypothetical protein [Bacteroidota bacterium]
MEKLISMTEFVQQTEDCVLQFMTEKTAYENIVAYKNFLLQPIKADMFLGEEPLFPYFVQSNRKIALENNIEKSFDVYGDNAFLVTIRRPVAKHSKTSSINTWFHLKTVGDLVGKVVEYEFDHPTYGWDKKEQKRTALFEIEKDRDIALPIIS